MSRAMNALTDPEPVRDLHRQFAELAGLEGHALDSTALTAAETARAVLYAINEGRHLLTGARDPTGMVTRPPARRP